MLRSFIRVAQITSQNKNVKCRNIVTSHSPHAWIFSKEASKSAGHSSLLANKNDVYEVRVEDVPPAKWEEYLERKADFMSLLHSKTDACQLVAGWKFIYGDVNFRAMYLFKYPEGFTDIDRSRVLLKTDEEYSSAVKNGYKLLKNQESEFLKSFSYWPIPTARSGSNIYDVRSYRLKPGNMYDWGNYWSKGIQCRKRVREDIPYAGFFTQLGRLHTVYHIWCYTDLADRKNCRDGTWTNDGWNDVVANTVPLVRSMKTRIMEPLPFSPTQ